MGHGPGPDGDVRSSDALTTVNYNQKFIQHVRQSFQQIDQSRVMMLAGGGAGGAINWLGSHFWSGAPFYHDSFEGTSIGWRTGVAGGGGTASLVTSWKASGDKALSLAVAAALNSKIFVERRLRLPASDRLGFGFFWTEGTNVEELEASLRVQKANQYTYYTLRYRSNNADKLIQRQTGAATWSDVATRGMLLDSLGELNFFFFVANLAAQKLDYLVWNSEMIPIDAAAYVTANTNDQDWLDLRISANNYKAVGETFYIDDVVLTFNEL